MGVNQLINIRTMAVNAEAVPGTFVLPEAADATIRVRDPQVSFNLAVDDENSKYANGYHAEDEAISGAKSGQITCSVKCAWGGAVGTDPAWWTLAKACGCTSIAYGAVGKGLVRRKAYDDVTYSIVVYDTEIGSDGGPATTMYQFAGCVGNMVIRADGIGAPWMADFTFTGKVVDVVDGVKLAMDAGTQATIAETFLGNTVSIHSTTPKISSFSFDLGNEINPIIDQGDASGYSHYVITATRPRFSCNPLAVKQATVDYLNIWDSETSGVISVASATASPHFTLKCVDTQLITPALGSREQFVSWDLTYKCLQNGVPGTLADAALTIEDTFELLQGARA